MAHLIYLNSYEINLSDLSHSQICQRVRSVICEAVRVRSERPNWEAVWEAVRVRSASHAQRAMLSDPRLNALLRPVEVRLARGSDCIARCAWEADRTLTASHTASQFGLSLRTLRQITWLCSVRGRARPPTASHRSDSQICEANLWGRESPIGLYRAKQCV